jgi:hypothetical protein
MVAEEQSHDDGGEYLAPTERPVPCETVINLRVGEWLLLVGRRQDDLRADPRTAKLLMCAKSRVRHRQRIRGTMPRPITGS